MGIHLIKYNQEHAAIERILQDVTRVGDFSTSGRLVAPMPRLVVDPVGIVSFPVPDFQVGSLIRAGTRAPYGRGPKTILDRKVRDCWQIDADDVRVGGPGWSKTFGSILQRVSEGMGLPAGRLDARLYKLLVYETGGFFSQHRDTEKVTGMVGTLVISLPVPGSGGELRIRHQDLDVTIDTCVTDPSELAYAAFFADCTHETLPVKEGHRICLVYNLVLQGKRSQEFARAPVYSKQVEALASVLDAWVKGSGSPRKIVWVLDHDYSQAGLSFDHLKGRDQTTAQLLSEAARKVRCSLYAAILHTWVSGAPGDDFWEFEYDLGRPIDDRVEIGEVFDSHCTIDQWVAEDGSSAPFGRIPLADGELLPRDVLANAKPDQKHVEEATGNEGISIDHIYWNAALVLWPRDRIVPVVLQAGIAPAVTFVRAAVAGTGSAGYENTATTKLVAPLIQDWPPGKGGYEDRSEVRIDFLRLLLDRNDQRSTSRFLTTIIVPRYSGPENGALIDAATKFGPEIFEGFLAQLVEARVGLRVKSIVDLTWRLTEATSGTGSKRWFGVLEAAVHSLFRSLETALDPIGKLTFWQRSRREAIDSETVERLLRIGWDFGLEAEASAAARLFAERPKIVSPDRDIPTVLSQLTGEKPHHSKRQAFGHLWRTSARFLLQRSESRPTGPRDWFIAEHVTSHCDACQRLGAFCKDRSARAISIKLNTQDRRHVKAVIRREGFPINCNTIRSGLPFTLVCTKYWAEEQTRLTEYRDDLQHMRLLIQSAGTGQTSVQAPALMQRLRVASGLER